MEKKYWVLLGLTLLLGIMSGIVIETFRSAGDTQPLQQVISADSEHVLGYGETADINGFDITVHESYITSQDNEELLVVDVSFFNNSESNKEIPLFNTMVTNEEGYSFTHVSDFEDRRLIGGQLRPEGLRRGTVAFELDKQSDYYEFSYTDHTGRGLASWALEPSAQSGEGEDATS
ncbi:DUF4352 domain-containing protein [Alteribacillus sp. HJP-4]|uniref:DUF4352 domain-containing protein n=1 Tax=Alteribacillus sp. HJP-4 TaxID=2775394 RepID=UPI0035CCDB05